MSPHNVCKCDRVTNLEQTSMASRKHLMVKLPGFYATNTLGPKVFFKALGIVLCSNFSRMRNSVQSIMCASKTSSSSKKCNHGRLFETVTTHWCLQMWKKYHGPHQIRTKIIEKISLTFRKHHAVQLLGFYATNNLKTNMLRNLHCAPKFSSIRTSVQLKMSATNKFLF